MRYIYFVTWSRPSVHHPTLSYAMTHRKTHMAWWVKEAAKRGQSLNCYRYPLVAFNEGMRQPFGWDLPTLISLSERI